MWFGTWTGTCQQSAINRFFNLYLQLTISKCLVIRMKSPWINSMNVKVCYLFSFFVIFIIIQRFTVLFFVFLNQIFSLAFICLSIIQSSRSLYWFQSIFFVELKYSKILYAVSIGMLDRKTSHPMPTAMSPHSLG